MSTPEGKVKAKVRDMLKKHGIWYFMPVSGGMGAHGVSDFVCCVGGYFLSIECKAARTSQVTALQKMQAERLQESGGTWLLVYDDATLYAAETMVINMLTRRRILE